MGNVNRGLIIPASDPLPEEDFCFTVYVPKNTDYIIHFFTALAVFTKWNSWRQADHVQCTEVAQRWSTAVEKTHTAFAEGSCMGDGVVLRMGEDCKLEVRDCEDPDVWRKVKTTSEEGGTGGYDPKYDDDAPTQYPDGPPPGQDVPCLAAHNVAAILEGGVNGFADLVGNGGLLGAIVGYTYTLLVNFVTIVHAYLWSEVSSVWANIVPGTIVADAAAFDYTELRCILLDAFSEDGTMTIAAHHTAVDQINTHFAESQIWAVLSFFFSLMGSVGATFASAAAGITSADCTDCVDSYHHVWDFTIDDQGWTNGANATYVAGQGWSGSGRGPYIRKTGPDRTVVMHKVVFDQAVNATTDSAWVTGDTEQYGYKQTDIGAVTEWTMGDPDGVPFTGGLGVGHEVNQGQSWGAPKVIRIEEWGLGPDPWA